MVGPLEGFADVWGTVFLKQVYSMEPTVAASFASLIFIGMCFGAPVLSFIAEKVGVAATIITAGICMAVSFLLLLSGSFSPGAISVSFVVVGVASAYQILAIYKASTYVREEVAGLTTAVANMIIMIFGYAFHSSIGLLVNAMGGTTQTPALLMGVAVIPAALFIGTCGFVALFIKDVKSKEKA
jgi:hypothetical protein